MNIVRLLTNRLKTEGEPWWEIVHDWEDEFSKALGVPLEHEVRGRIRTALYWRIRVLTGMFWRFRPVFRFEMHSEQWIGFNKVNLCPCIIDFFIREDSGLLKFYKSFSRNPVVFISSKEVFDFLLEKKCPLRIAHLPLSLPDSYMNYLDANNKQYDVVLVGRVSTVLMQYFLKYLQTHPNLVYVQRVDLEGVAHYQTNTGIDLGACSNRKAYFEAMLRSKVALYSTPGMDNDRRDANGYNQVTPRFLEMLSCGCHVLSRYINNPDTEYYELGRMSVKIENYDQFEQAISTAISKPINREGYVAYLSKHLSSVRARQLKEILRSI